MTGNPSTTPADQPYQSAVNPKILKRIYQVALPFALYFFFSDLPSDSDQARWPMVVHIALGVEVLIGGAGVIAFFSWWPICLIFGRTPITDRLCRFGGESMLWAIHLVPLWILFSGLNRLMHGPICF